MVLLEIALGYKVLIQLKKEGNCEESPQTLKHFAKCPMIK